MRRTRLAGWAKVALAALAAATLLAPPAHADEVEDTLDLAVELANSEEASSSCRTHYERHLSQVSAVCIMVDGNGRYGDAGYDGPDYETSFIEATVYVQRCQAIDNRAVNCSTIAANGTQGGYGETDQFGRYYVRTSTKPANYGWIYRACYSLKNNETAYSVVNRCSKFIVGSPAP